jgi:hypothetical protein
VGEDCNLVLRGTSKRSLQIKLDQKSPVQKVHLLLLDLINPDLTMARYRKLLMNSRGIWGEAGKNDNAKNDNMFDEINTKMIKSAESPRDHKMLWL